MHFLFIREWHQNFREECPDGILDKDAIMKIYDEISPLGNSKDFVDHIFRIFDKDASGSIDFIEFMMATDMTASGTPEEKLRWAFKVGVLKKATRPPFTSRKANEVMHLPSPIQLFCIRMR